MTFRHFGCVAALLLCSPALFAQTPITVACGAAAPVSLEVVPVKAGDAAAVATIKNKDTRPISVVFLSWKLTDSMRNSENEIFPWLVPWRRTKQLRTTFRSQPSRISR